MTMHLIVCPHCGKQMKTKALVRGTILCPGCQVKFKAPEPRQGGAAIRQDEAKHDLGYILSFAFFGLVFVFSFFATGGVWFIQEGFDDDWWIILGPFYLAQVFLVLFFLMPLISWLFGQGPKSKTKHVVASNSSDITGWSTPPMAQETNHHTDIMRISLAIGVALAIISVVIGAVIIWFFVDLGLQILGSGGCC